MNLMPFDELNTLHEIVARVMDKPKGEREQFRDWLMDEVLDILILSYVYGNKDGNEGLASDVGIDRDALDESVYKRINGENWEERIGAYFENGTADEIYRVVETDSHRIYNDAVMNVGEAENAKAHDGIIAKQWVTMRDDRVRDTHDYLEGMTIPLNDRFYTYDGDSARYPGDFEDPANNVNCRCGIRLTKLA